MTQTPEPVGPGVWAIQVPMANPRNPHAFSYLIEDGSGDAHLVDAGLDDGPGRDALEHGLAALGRTLGDVRSVTVTHQHRDHLGIAERIRRAGGATVAMHEADAAALGVPRNASERDLDAWGVPTDRRPALLEVYATTPQPVHVDVRLRDGDPLPIPGRDLVVLYTPGHTPGHSCFVSASERLVFTGDHLLPDQFAGVGLGGPTATNPLRDYRASLARVRELDGYRALPGHGWVFDTVAQRVDETLAHHGRRTAEVAAALERDPDASVWSIAEQLTWSHGFAALAGLFLLSALRQTAWHRDLVLGP